MNAGERAMTLAEFGASIGVSATTAWRIFRAGQVTVVNVGSRARPRLRVTATAADAYLKLHEIQGSRA
jgi:predicted site-specific integrase-resolvase